MHVDQWILTVLHVTESLLSFFRHFSFCVSFTLFLLLSSSTLIFSSQYNLYFSTLEVLSNSFLYLSFFSLSSYFLLDL